ncbi:helix-turn-helix transcriptional regulator [Streptomyces wuyuanensis]|uniref:helix-turn-helix transcriptional regulator n=1 Tax=Streptomyces wuyuanensis TaxID=1196353 RepID=UPI00341BCC33
MRRWPFVGRDAELTRFTEALTRKECPAFYIEGPPGSGKSRLAERCLQVSQEIGYGVSRAAVNADSLFPLGAVAHILPEDYDLKNPLAGFNSLRERIYGTRVRGDRHVILVDDLNLIDDVSATLIDQLMSSGAMFLLATMEYEEPASLVVRNIRNRDAANRVFLDFADEDQVAEILSESLGGMVAPRAINFLHRKSRGNLLYLRELVIGAYRAGKLQFDGQIWEIDGYDEVTPRLAELVKTSLDTADLAGRRVLDTLALCGSSGKGLFPAKAIDELESQDLVRVHRHGRRSGVEIAHPMHREVLTSQITAARKEELLLAHAQAVRVTGARRHEDLRHIALWELSAKGSTENEILLKSALAARKSHEAGQLRILAEAACRHQNGFLPRLLLGEAQVALGDVAHASGNLKEAAMLARTDEEHVQASLALGRVMCWTKGDTEEALHIVVEAEERVVTPEALAILRMARGVFLSFLGRIREALEILKDVPAIPNQYIRAVGEGTRATLITLCGDPHKGLSEARRALEDRRNLSDGPELPHPSSNIHPVAYSLQELGRLGDAYAILLDAWNESIRDQIYEGMVLHSSQLARTALMQGHLVRARRWAAQSVSLARRYNFTGPLHAALTRQAEAAALLGETAVAAESLREAAPLPEWGNFIPELCLGHVWLQAVKGNITEARSAVRENILKARESGNSSCEARLLTDLARLGAPQEAVQGMADLAAGRSEDYTVLRARFVEALCNKSPEELTTLSLKFEMLDSELISAECLADAAAIWRKRGDRRAANAAAHQMERLRRKCDDARTPALRQTEHLDPLTSRELEVAMLAAEGNTNAEVARKMFISKRTVDNHLQRVYGKLGVRTRRELKDKLDELDGA